MKLDKPLRVMWLLNHGSARRFDIPMLKRVGVDEIFLPKHYPNDPAFRSASVDYSEDSGLTIPKRDLEVLNAADWYSGPNRECWEIANRHFQAAFFILHKPHLLKVICKQFKGALLWRVFGLAAETGSYSRFLKYFFGSDAQYILRPVEPRFHFAHAYRHLADAEEEVLARRALYLPLGMGQSSRNDQWTGRRAKILFVCPDIGLNPYYSAIYERFKRDFSGLAYSIGGAQSIVSPDPDVLGFLPQEQHDANMRDYRVMFYHSQEANHVHYHPFEAIRAGMPLIFMSGGLLDLLGGRALPGRCATTGEARAKLERILDGDEELIARVRQTQTQLLNAMNPDVLAPDWREAFARIVRSVEHAVPLQQAHARKAPRIAVILPEAYRGGTLRAAKLVAAALEAGARQCGEAIDVVLGHLDDDSIYSDDDFGDLPGTISRRPFRWLIIDKGTARRASTYAKGNQALEADYYQVPNDGMNQFLDCDLWVVISDRLRFPLLPLKPYLVVVYDYLQRHEAIMPPEVAEACLEAARQADRVIVTSQAARSDASQFAGLSARKVVVLPKLVGPLAGTASQKLPQSRYFLWTTNLGPHKNHEAAIRALRHYYEDLDGMLECRMSGVSTQNFSNSELPHLTTARKLMNESRELRRKFKIMGELSEAGYHAQLTSARFVWHPARRDNGTFAVVEAAWCGVPALSSDYPAMREIDEAFGLKLLWMDPSKPSNMARQLKVMEQEAANRCQLLPTVQQLSTLSWEAVAPEYWKAVRECL